MFTRMIPGRTAGTLFDSQAVRNLHHDKNGRENRVVTVLVYLSSAAENDGGHTLFPCLAAAPCPLIREDLGGCTDVAGLFERELTQLFQNGSRVVNPLTERDGLSDAQLEAQTALLEEASYQCRMAQNSQTLSVRPTKGTAIVFWNVESDGRPNLRTWHAGCQAMSGATRTAIQKFKEAPRVSGEWVLDPSTKQPRWQPLPGGSTVSRPQEDRARDEL